ncbi:phytanoyl-CoA dioxygenase family protein [Dyadobacter luticola]|uniref:Phytanoyl-CoA dioxygenase n=1 Tax=Dyadobacter luticola TaxID=1979387 RepID=A0A5R9L4K2_9BACT|nr:phytanoyl-CoA dioxygenase family protein [Dyadobacter luticola]TLV03279.1 phytanoyl-CoA dioxygenase [Dyadobacter luticola]
MTELTETQVRHFIEKGYIRLDDTFSAELAEQGREILWKDTGCDPTNPATWTKPVIRLGDYAQEPFRQAVNAPRLHKAFDQLVGAGKWLPRYSLGTFPVRFPSENDPGDTGWHVEASFPGNEPVDYFKWRINVKSRGRALLMLFLFSDIEENDAPTRIREGSHIKVASILEPFSDDGLTFIELAERLNSTEGLPEVSATGKAGTVYFCHPFLVHSAQSHRGQNPRFMAQPPLMPAGEFNIYDSEIDFSPVEEAIRKGLEFL